MPRRIASAVCGLLIATAVGRPLGAQQRSSLDVGFSVVQFPDDSSTVAGPSVGWLSSGEWRRLFGTLNAGGVGTYGAATGSVSLGGGARTPAWAGWLAEGSTELYGVAGSNTHGAATATATARLLRVIGHGGAWGRASASLSRRESSDLPGQSAEMGAWWSWSRGRLSASVLDQRAKGQLFTGPFREQLVGTIPVHYAEGTLGLRLESDDASLDIAVGARRDPDALQLVEPTLSVTAAVWQSATRAWTISVSRVPPDFVRGADAARWLAIGMRFYEPRPAAVRAARVQPIVHSTGTGERRTVRVRAAGARTVELMADFTDWAPVTMTATPSGFEYEAALTPGSHRMLVRIDGGGWRPAANTPAVNDDLGGRVGLLVVQ